MCIRDRPCAVDADNPICLGTGKRGFIEPVIVAAVSQMGKALSDCAVFQRADPQALERDVYKRQGQALTGKA